MKGCGTKMKNSEQKLQVPSVFDMSKGLSGGL